MTTSDKDAAGALSALSQQHTELADLLVSLQPDDWQRPTRCPGWSVADVVLHLAQTDEMAVASLEGRVGAFMAQQLEGQPPAANVDDGAALMVERERGITPPQLLERWTTASSTLDAMLAQSDGHKRVTWVAGELSVRTLATTRLAECWIHAGDVAEAVGVRLQPGERLRHVARLAWRTLPYAFAREGKRLSGPVAFELTGPGGEPWTFRPDAEPVTVVRGDGVELCMVAARRAAPSETGLTAEGADAGEVLELVRTYA